MRPAFAVAAEVLEDRAAPSESLMAILGGGLLMGLMPQSPGETSPALSESFLTDLGGNGDLASLRFPTIEAGLNRPRESHELPAPLDHKQDAVSTPTLADISSRLPELAHSEILPAVLDELLISPLQSPNRFAAASSPLPELGHDEPPLDQDTTRRAAAGPKSNPPAGLGNTHPEIGTTQIESSTGLDAQALGAGGQAVPSLSFSSSEDSSGGIDPPEAYPEYYSTQHDHGIYISALGILENDVDYNNDPLTAVLVTGPSHYSFFNFNSAGNGGFDYVPTGNWSGTDSFTYRAFDGTDLSEPTTVTFYVNNYAPVVQDQYYVVLQATKLEIAAPGVLDGAYDAENDSFIAMKVTEPDQGGSVVLQENGSFIYTPLPGFVGRETFQYLADDGIDAGQPMTVSIDVAEWRLNVLVNSNNDLAYYDPDDEMVEMDDPGMIFGVNDDDDNQNEIIDSDPTEAPFPFADDDLVPAYLSYGDYSGMPGNKAGLQLQLSVTGNIKIWSSPTKQYELTEAAFTFGEDQIARWQAPDQSQMIFPETVFLEGIEPGTATISLALLGNMQVQAARDDAKVRPVKVDIDTDSDNDGTINTAPNPTNLEDLRENFALFPGNLLNYNVGDTVQGVDQDLELAKISYDAGGADLTGYKLVLRHEVGTKLWLTQSKDPLPDEDATYFNKYVWTIGNPNITIPTDIYIEGYAQGKEKIGFSIHRPNANVYGAELPQPIHGDAIQVTVVPKVKLHFVTFENEHEITADPPATGNPTLYDSQHWLDGNLDGDVLDAGDHQWPVAYTRSTATANSTLKLSVELVLNAAWNGAAIQVKADGPGNIDIPATAATVAGTTVTITNIFASNPFPTTVRHYDNFDLDWQISFDGGNTWTSVGTSSNDLYLTLNAPTPTPLYHTVVHIGSHNADGESTVTGTVTLAWNPFAGRVINRIGDGVLMRYNHDADTTLTAEDMLAHATGKGQCTAWADLWVQVLGAQGITATSTRIDPDNNHIEFSVKLMPAQGSAGANYTIGTINHPLFPTFGFHQVVRVNGFPDTIFDPSYGTKVEKTDPRSVELKYEDETLTHLVLPNGTFVADPKGTAEVVFTP